MKILYSLFLICLSGFSLSAQTYLQQMDSVVQKVNLDSLILQVRNLTGENPCTVNGKAVTIKNRVSSTGNDLAGDYLKEQLQRYGLKVIDQKYSSGGRNIVAEQPGALYPDKKYIISCHYDAVANYCADDNASGSAAILEIVRHLSRLSFKHTIVYAFWDEEETGLLGSKYYAQDAKKKNDEILGVLNMDMIGYDGNNDFAFEVHTKPVVNSVALANRFIDIKNSYKLKLKEILKNPGTDRSDHASFWNNGYSALLFIEAYFSGDANPYYHKATDRISAFNMPYFHELSKLALAGIATMAEPYGVINGVETADRELARLHLKAYPNPAMDQTVIHYSLPDKMNIQLEVYNPLNNVRIAFVNELRPMGEHQFNLNTSDLAAGIYFVLVKSESGLVASCPLLIIGK